MNVEIINNILGIGTLLLQIIIITFLILVLYTKKSGKKFESLDGVWAFIKNNALILAFLIVLFGTLLSLYYSEVIGYQTCNLCWLQRVLIYPQVLILGIAIWKKQKDIFDYLIGLNIIGLIIAIYNHYLQISGKLGYCGSGGVACNKLYVFEFGYITIPMMAITLFISVILLTYVYKKTYSGKNKY